jgi:hypothetical protein
LVGQKNPGDKVVLIISRSGKEYEMALTMQNEEARTANIKNDQILLQGAAFQALSDNEKAKFNIDYGFKIASIGNGKLKSAGISTGFIILYVDRKPLRTIQDLKESLANHQGGVLIEGIYPNGLRAYYGIGL